MPRWLNTGRAPPDDCLSRGRGVARSTLRRGSSLVPRRIISGARMIRSNQSKVLFTAVSTGMAAQFNDTFDPVDVDRLAYMAQSFLDADDPALRLVEGAATAFALVRHDPKLRRDWGLQLRDDALRIGRPVPVDHHRSDIHG